MSLATLTTIGANTRSSSCSNPFFFPEEVAYQMIPTSDFPEMTPCGRGYMEVLQQDVPNPHWGK